MIDPKLITKIKAPPSRPSDIATMIPPKIRDYFSLKAGDHLIWNVLGDVIVIKKTKIPRKK